MTRTGGSPAERVAVVGMACHYPDARSPERLWENVVAGRKAFRRIPPERLRIEDYDAATAGDADSIACTEAALLHDWEFDRVGFRVAGGSFRAADLTHWLALDVASRALADAGFPGAEGLPKDGTGVLVGNSLTGEFSRAQILRLRWPYVRRTLGAALAEEGWSPERTGELLDRIEGRYKEPFDPPGEETLAGGLANTIAGRICNHFDLGGGGYTVDGACASSLLAIANACSALVAGDLDVALAGGVDLSLDPFELVGFSRTGALSSGEMRVFDRHSQGFLPGEGSGVVVLMRLDEALARGCRVLAVVAGWGISSDGGGGLTRPESDGQLRALTRAYERAGFGPDEIALFEAHGTGTPVGDAAELAALSRLRRSAGARSPAAIGSIKALIGHTKAAAGVAGTIKTIQALRHEILPPTFGCETPHPILVEGLGGDGPPALRVVPRAEPWPEGHTRRAGVSAMGFGGINSHLVLEAAVPRSARAGRQAEPARLGPIERLLDRSPQEAELLVLSAGDAPDLAERARTLADEAEGLSRAELTDLAGELSEADSERPVRCAVVARNPGEAARRLRRAAARLSGEGPGSRAGGDSSPGLDPGLDPSKGVLVGRAAPRPRIGFLFPGQGAPLHRGGGAWTRRFEEAEEVYRRAAAIAPARDEGGDTSTAIAQPEIVKGSLAGLALLERLGVEASVAIGHSLGELAALHWAGSLSDRELVRIADARGRVMEESAPPGAMISLRCAVTEVERLLDGVAGGGIAAINGSEEVVVSGPPEAVDTIAERARRERIPVVRLRVSRAFHSPSMERALPGLGRALDEILTPASRRSFRPAAGRSVVSTVTGALLEPGHDLSELLLEQLTRPVRFSQALAGSEDVAGPVDLWLEVGPGRILSRLAAQCDAAPAIPLDAGGPGTAGLLTAAGALFCLGAPVSPDALFRDRFLRPVRRDRRLLRNPCERAPSPGAAAPSRSARPEQPAASAEIPDPGPGRTPARPDPEASDPVGIVRHLVSSQTELPVESLAEGDRMLSDLHLNSIAVGQLVVEAARRMGAAPPADPTDYADASVAEIAASLRRLVEANDGAGARPGEPQGPPPGVESWVRPFSVELVGRELRELPDSRDSSGSNLPGAFTLIAPEDVPAVERLRETLGADSGSGSGAAGVVVWLPEDPAWPTDRRAVTRLLDGARTALAERTTPFVLVVPVAAGDRRATDRRGVGAAFARCLHLERRRGSVTVVQVPSGHRDAAAWVAAEIRNAGDGYSEAVYDATGRRRVPVLRLVERHGGPETAEGERTAGETTLPLGSEDVLLVSGGGRGIAAECALALARATGASLALIGRSLPDESPELAANLERLATAGIRFQYRPADVTDPEEVAAAVADLSRELGSVTALLHGAGINEPRLIPALDPERMAATRRPKVDGLARLLEAVDERRLRLLVAFGSIIARTGMPGEADYALANEELAVAVERFAAEHPACRCHTIEWSVWSGVGMGERLSSVEGLSAQGIAAIPTDRGVAALQDLLSHPEAPVSVVVAGRYGDPPTLGTETPELPLLRFLERPRLHVPGVELVVDTVLDGSSDPYVADHALDREPLLPAVMGLEAMAQAATALEGDERPGDRPVFERVELLRPIVVPEDGTTLRVAVLRLAPGRFAAVVRSSYTGFQSDHFRALCRLRPPESERTPERTPEATSAEPEPPPLDLDPARDLYGGVMFHAGRFRRLRAYRRLSATDCLADIAPDTAGPWFARQLPDRLLLGDPAARDASLHAIQACIPHATVLPIGIEHLETGALDPGAAHSVEARERSREGKTLVYDLVIRDAAGRPIERWQGLTLRIVAPRNGTGPWPRALLAPYLERRVGDLFGENAVSIAVVPEEPSNGSGDAAARRRASDRAARELLARTNGHSRVLRRPDGKPEIPGGPGLSLTHGAGFALAAAAERGLLGCDAESILPEENRPWSDLLGPVRSELAAGIARETGGDPEVGFTRIWTALECLKKAGLPRDAPLTLERVTDDDWVLLRSGPALVATGLIRSARDEPPQVVALLWGAADGHPVPDEVGGTGEPAGEQLGRGGDELPPG